MTRRCWISSSSAATPFHWATARCSPASPRCATTARQPPRAWLESARDEDFAAVAPATPLAAVVHVADRLVRKAGIGVEPVVDPTRDAIELACVFDLTAAAARLQSLREAQERFDSHFDAGR